MSYLKQARAEALGDSVTRIDTAIAAVQGQVREVRKEQYSHAAAAETLSDDLVGVLTSGHGFHPNWLEAVTGTLNLASELNRALGVLDDTTVKLKRMRDEAITNSHGIALRWLDGALQALLEEVRRTPAGDVPADPGAAIRAGTQAIKLYKAAEAQVAAYRDLRAAQVRLTADARGSMAGVPQLVARSGLSREPHDVDYLTRTRQLTTTPIELTNGWRFDGTAYPGVDMNPSDPLMPTREPAAYLRWLADRGDAWVPSVVELEQADECRRVATQMNTREPDLIGHDHFGRLPHLNRLEPTKETDAA